LEDLVAGQRSQPFLGSRAHSSANSDSPPNSSQRRLQWGASVAQSLYDGSIQGQIGARPYSPSK
jgi:hypothetical protein